MKKMKKSTWLPLVLFIYVTAMAIYLGPRNHDISVTEKTLTIIASYIIVFTLWLVLRKKEKIQQKTRDEEEQQKLSNK